MYDSSRALAATLAILTAGVAWAQSADGGVPADGGVAGDGGTLGVVVPSPKPAGGPGRTAHAGSPIAQALDDFDFGAYESVVTRLRPLVDALGELTRELPDKADRLEALRVYGIACTLTGRKTAAEGAFLLLLREEPSTRLDPALVRPEAVAYFDEVRARHREELLAAYRKTRPRYFWALNLIPVAGQFQNKHWKKAIVLGSIEIALLAGTAVTYGLLAHYEGDHHDFDGHQGMYDPLRYTNYVCFGALLAVTAGGIIDAFVFGQKRRERERRVEAGLGL
jgi:hypothetical protein